jgi:hypothetical protein
VLRKIAVLVALILFIQRGRAGCSRRPAAPAEGL